MVLKGHISTSILGDTQYGFAPTGPLYRTLDAAVKRGNWTQFVLEGSKAAVQMGGRGSDWRGYLLGGLAVATAGAYLWYRHQRATPHPIQASGNSNDGGGQLIQLPTGNAKAAVPAPDEPSATNARPLAEVYVVTHTRTSPKTTGPSEAESVAEFMPLEFLKLEDAIKELAKYVGGQSIDSPIQYSVVQDRETGLYLIVRRKGETVLGSQYEEVAQGIRLGPTESAMAALPHLDDLREADGETLMTVVVWSKSQYAVLSVTPTPETLRELRKRVQSSEIPLVFELEQGTDRSMLVIHPEQPDIVVQITESQLRQFREAWLRGERRFPALMLEFVTDEETGSQMLVESCRSVRLRPTANGKGALLSLFHKDRDIDVYIPLPQKSLRQKRPQS